MYDIANIQIFTIEKFEDASKLANKKREADLQFAIDEFAKVQTVIKRSRYILYANSGGLEPDPQARLDRVLAANQPISLVELGE